MRSTSGPSLASPVAAISQSALHKEDLHPIPSPARQQQQVSPPRPLHAPRDYRAVGAALLETKLNDDGNDNQSEIKESREWYKTRIPSFHRQLRKSVVNRPNIQNIVSIEKSDYDVEEGQRKQVMSPLDRHNTLRNDNLPRRDSQAEQPLMPFVEKVST